MKKSLGNKIELINKEMQKFLGATTTNEFHYIIRNFRKSQLKKLRIEEKFILLYHIPY